MELKRFKRNPSLAWKLVDDLAVAIDECENKVFHFNSVGTEIWKSLDGHRTVGQVIRTLFVQFEAPESRIRKDALSLLNQLIREELILES